jgi:hypothetical protein
MSGDDPAKFRVMRLLVLIAAIVMPVVCLSSALASKAEPRPLPAFAAVATECGGQDAEEAGSDAGSDDEDAPPRFSRSFFNVWFSIDTSTDGFESPQLPVSIEAVCDTPRRFSKQAGQLDGGDGIVVVAARTRVWNGRQLLSGQSRVTELDGADTAHMKVRLRRPKRWLEDEDGSPVPTFSARRIDITD